MFSRSSNTLNQSIKRIVTADEVERYVDKVQSRLQSPAEKKSKAFAFARLYYDAKDFGTAKKYLEDYLTIQDRDFRVHNLMGQCEEALENNEGALSSYKKSLELCSTQNDIVVKVVTLCTKCPMDPLRAKLWADKGSRVCPGHPAVFDLKWHLLQSKQPKDYEEMELLLADELARRAREPSLHIKLVKLYMEAGSYKRAFLHCQSVQKTGAFDESMDWLQCACDVFDHQRQKKDEGRISSSLIFALTLCKLTTLHLKSSSSRQCTAILHRFDKTVKEIIKQTPHDIFDGLSPEWKDCITEMKGQLYLNVVIYIIKLAQENVISWLKAKRISAAVLMACWQIDLPQTTSKILSKQVNYQNMHSYAWATLACSRLSQTGHLLLYLEEVFEHDWMRNCVVDICTEQGHAALLDNIYPDNVSLDSFLACDEEFKQTEFRMPDINDLIKYDEVSVAEHATDLHHIVWLGLHWGILNEQIKPGVGVIIGRLFEGIALDVKNLNNCHHSSLSLRDIEAFIYGVIRSSKNIHLDVSKTDEALLLPPTVVCDSLVTQQQTDWWQAAYGLYSGKFGSQAVSKLKTIMQKGLETLRCMKNHGIDPRILIYISLAFWEKGLTIESSKKEEYDYKDHWQSLQKRSMHYMKEALRILEIFRSNKTIPVVETPLILPLSEPLQEEEIASLLNKNYLKLAESAMLGGNLEEALKYYEEVKSLQSFYSQSQIYIRLASASDRKSVEGEKNHLLYIKKAKEKLSICINNADHSPEFKQTLINELQELEMTADVSPHTTVIPKSKKALNFQVEVPAADVGIDDSQIYASTGEIPQELETSALQEQLDAKESEIKSLKQALAMYKAHIDMQKHYQVVQPVMNQPPLILQPFPPSAQHRHIRSLDSTTSQTVTPLVQNEIGTPSVPGGLETPSDMWWDSFSPQPSFEKGYFAGLAQHAQQSREERGEGEAPTLKDTVDPSLDQHTEESSMSIPTVDSSLAPNESFPAKDTPNISSSPAPGSMSASPAVPKTPSSPAVASKDVLSPKTPTSPSAYEGADIYVEPIVHLTSKSDIVTGEEGEVVKFVHRAKLYRFDKEVGQWKERGLGDVKILYNEETKKSRITMRREQVFRVCCNHVITSEMSLDAKQGAKAAWSWFTAADATESETRPEQFTIKFKNQEIADKFKEAFDEAKEMLTATSDVAEEAPMIASATPVAAQPVNPFLNVTNIAAVCPNLVSPPQQSQAPTAPFGMFGAGASPMVPPPPYSERPGGFQFTFGPQGPAQSIANQSFNGFTFQPQTPSVQGGLPAMPIQGNMSVPPPQYPTAVPDPSIVQGMVNAPVVVPILPQPVIPSADGFPNIPPISSEVESATELTPTNLSGFSFSNKTPEINIPQTMAATVVESATTDLSTTNFPIMSSLLKDSASANAPVTPENTAVIEGMSQLPVFQKGLLDKNINPASFWSSTSPEKPFFTGNSVGLEAIGHKEESRVPDEDDPAKEAAGAAKTESPHMKLMDLNTSDAYDNYDYEDYEDGYYDENGEFYNEYYGSGNEDDDDDDDDEIDEYSYENVPDNQPSSASSSRRGSNDEDLETYLNDDRPVEDRFDIPKKAPNVSIVDVINDDLVITKEAHPTFAQKLKASRFQLPSTFYLYESKSPCTGCRKCIADFDVQKQKDKNAVKPVETPVKPVEQPKLTLGSGFSTGVSFSSLAAQGSTGFSGSTGAFTGAGAQLFASPSTGAAGNNEEDPTVDPNYDPQYDAIVTLQKVDTIQTGEEDDHVMFKHRSKLYRFDEKWRERGVGDIKVTRNVRTGYCRVIMRRDIIHKLCANHAIMPNMELKPLNSSDCSVVWFTPSDYSEGAPPVPQSFCAKFKNKEICEQFKEQFELCKKYMDEKLKTEAAEGKKDDASTKVPETKPAEKVKPEPVAPVAKSEPAPSKTKGGLFSKFAPKAGSWECSGCYLRNDADVAKCPACETPNPTMSIAAPAPAPVPSKPFQAPPAQGGLLSKFAPKPGSWECSGCYLRNNSDVAKCPACETPNPNKPAEPAQPAQSNFSFGSASGSTSQNGFSFGSNQSPAFSFGAQQSEKPSSGFSFGSAAPTQSSGFSFGSTPSSNQSSGFSFGSSNSTASFSFGTKTEVEPPTTSIVPKPEGPSFGAKQDSTVSSFSFGTKPETGSAGFSFGSSKSGVTNAPKLNVGWGAEGNKIESTKTTNQDNMNRFAADPDTWECPSCLAKNDGVRELCRNCNVPREKTPVVTLDPSQFSTPINQQINTSSSAPVTPVKFSFSPKPAPSPTFSWDAGSTKPDPGIVNKERDKELMPPPSFLPVMTKDDKKGSPKAETSKPESSAWVPQGLNLSNLFSFGTTPSPSLSNASSVDDLSQVSTVSSKVPSAFSGTSFTFKFEPPSTTKSPSKEEHDAPASPGSHNEDNEEEDGNTSFEFSPLVSVTQIEHSSGEEDERCVFSARTKMFRFDTQWKERGIGEIKILLHTITGQYRLIMRRDQTHKLCANHILIKGMTIKPMAGGKKAYTWKTSADISDGEAKEQLFAARFKEELISEEFKAAFETACTDDVIVKKSTTKKQPEVIEIVDSDEEDIVAAVETKEVDVEYEARVKDDLKLKSKALLLPASFFNVPSAELGAEKKTTPSTPVLGTSPVHNKDGTDDDTPNLTLTHEKIPDVSSEKQSDKMLLPKGFYNYKESANLTDENVEVITDETNVNIDELYANGTDFSPFELKDSMKILFDEKCTVFRLSSQTNDYVKLKSGELKVNEENTDKRFIVLVSNGLVCFSVEITEETVLTTRSDSKNTYDIEAINLAQKQIDIREKFALKFSDLLTCEKFSSLIDDSRELCKKAKSQTNGHHSSPFGSKLFGNSSQTLSFASMISNQSSGFKDNSGQAFVGAGQSLFGAVSKNKDSDDAGDQNADPSTEESNIYVEPIVQLESIQTTSGEESEWVCFNNRCKLYVFDSTTKKWKERGVGELKLLRHKENSSARVVMRRDQVHKLCANHFLLPSTKLEPFKENTVTWSAVGDVSNGPPENCVLAARFKNETILNDFREKFQALCNKEDVQPIVDSEAVPAGVTGQLVGSCDPVLAKSLSQVKI